MQQMLHRMDKKKLAQALRRRFGSDHSVPILRVFSADAMSKALGQGNVIHAVLTAGSASQSFLKQAQMLQAFAGQDIEFSDRSANGAASGRASDEATEGNDRR